MISCLFFLHLQELESELESLRSSAAAKDTGNGPVEVTDGSGGEELATTVRERDELKTQVQQLESKLEDLKTKNNVCHSSERVGGEGRE